jgi:hypothetical protein
MKNASASVLHTWTHNDINDAAKEITEAVGDISEMDVFGSQILVGDYLRPAKTKGGLWTPADSQKEDVFQGKVTMILKIGPTAFSEKDADLYGGTLPKVGDWVFNRAMDSFQLSVKGDGSVNDPSREFTGWPCRLIYAADLYGRVKHPQIIV